MDKFKGVDYFNLDSLLSEEEVMVRNTVRAYVDEQIIPIIEKHYREEIFPYHLLKELGKLGLFGITLPQKYGCAAMNNVV